MSRLVILSISFRYKEEFSKELHQIFLTEFFEKFPFRVNSTVPELPSRYRKSLYTVQFWTNPYKIKSMLYLKKLFDHE